MYKESNTYMYKFKLVAYLLNMTLDMKNYLVNKYDRMIEQKSIRHKQALAGLDSAKRNMKKRHAEEMEQLGSARTLIEINSNK